MHDRSISGPERQRSQSHSASPNSASSNHPKLPSRSSRGARQRGSEYRPLHRLALITASLLIAASLWFMLDDGDQLGAVESQPGKLAGQNGPPADVVAQVEGVSITEGEVHETIADELERLEAERSALIEAAVEHRIRQLLIEGAAAEAGLDREQLLEQEVEGKLVSVSDAVVASVAIQRGLDVDEPEVALELRRELRLAAFIEELRQRADVVRYVESAAG